MVRQKEAPVVTSLPLLRELFLTFGCLVFGGRGHHKVMG